MLAFLFVLGSCDDEASDQQKILGTWISGDNVYKLEFTDSDSFLKNGVPYDYTLFSDSIQIRYNGMLDIYVQPTKHKYSLKKNVLEIDFSNKSCYGFPLEKIMFERK